jgi:hypothetical protein
MKRHGDNPTVPALDDPAAKFGQPITGMVNGTFCLSAASLPCFLQKVASIPEPKRKIRGLVRPYRVALLTMIKIVLIAAISFAPPSQ